MKFFDTDRTGMRKQAFMYKLTLRDEGLGRE